MLELRVGERRVQTPGLAKLVTGSLYRHWQMIKSNIDAVESDIYIWTSNVWFSHGSLHRVGGGLHGQPGFTGCLRYVSYFSTLTPVQRIRRSLTLSLTPLPWDPEFYPQQFALKCWAEFFSHKMLSLKFDVPRFWLWNCSLKILGQNFGFGKVKRTQLCLAPKLTWPYYLPFKALITVTMNFTPSIITFTRYKD